MAGVIDERGQQWEHCGYCGGFVKIEELRYEQPSEEHPYGVDMCKYCDEWPMTRAMRKAQNDEKRREDVALYQETVFPTVCGHGAKPGQVVYRFEGDATSPEGATAKTYCSEECANRG